jgi:hypothetical protein
MTGGRKLRTSSNVFRCQLWLPPAKPAGGPKARCRCFFMAVSRMVLIMIMKIFRHPSSRRRRLADDRSGEDLLLRSRISATCSDVSSANTRIGRSSESYVPSAATASLKRFASASKSTPLFLVFHANSMLSLPQLTWRAAGSSKSPQPSTKASGRSAETAREMNIS